MISRCCRTAARPCRSPSGTEKFTPTVQPAYCPAAVASCWPFGASPLRPFQRYSADALSCGSA